MARLENVEGIGTTYAMRLREAGVATARSLLKKGATPQGRKELAEKSGISEKMILEWVNHLDLFRVRGVGSEYADLLEEAGVDTVPELAQRTAANLYARLMEVNQAKKLVRRLPTQAQVEGWIAEARKLPRVIMY